MAAGVVGFRRALHVVAGRHAIAFQGSADTDLVVGRVHGELCSVVVLQVSGAAGIYGQGDGDLPIAVVGWRLERALLLPGGGEELPPLAAVAPRPLCHAVPEAVIVLGGALGRPFGGDGVGVTGGFYAEDVGMPVIVAVTTFLVVVVRAGGPVSVGSAPPAPASGPLPAFGASHRDDWRPSVHREPPFDPVVWPAGW